MKTEKRFFERVVKFPYVAAICDACGEASGPPDGIELPREMATGGMAWRTQYGNLKGWRQLFRSDSFDDVECDSDAYCPDCVSKLLIFQK